MVIWLTVGTIFICCIYGLHALVHEGPERAKALEVIAGTCTAYMLVRRFLL